MPHKIKYRFNNISVHFFSTRYVIMIIDLRTIPLNPHELPTKNIKVLHHSWTRMSQEGYLNVFFKLILSINLDECHHSLVVIVSGL